MEDFSLTPSPIVVRAFVGSYIRSLIKIGPVRKESICLKWSIYSFTIYRLKFHTPERHFRQRMLKNASKLWQALKWEQWHDFNSQSRNCGGQSLNRDTPFPNQGRLLENCISCSPILKPVNECVFLGLYRKFHSVYPSKHYVFILK